MASVNTTHMQVTLMTLAIEVRLNILRYVVQTADGKALRFDISKFPIIKCSDNLDLAVLRTCKQLHMEGLDQLHRHTVFEVAVHGWRTLELNPDKLTKEAAIKERLLQTLQHARKLRLELVCNRFAEAPLRGTETLIPRLNALCGRLKDYNALMELTIDITEADVAHNKEAEEELFTVLRTFPVRGRRVVLQGRTYDMATRGWVKAGSEVEVQI